MGIKRVVDTEIWTDDKVENFTPEEKYFWVYLLTNPFTKQLGIYKITKKQMSFQLGYDTETITKLLDRFENEHKLIKYIENEVAIRNYLKHSIVKGGKPVEDCLTADLRMVKHKSLIKWVFGSLNQDDVNETVKNVIEYWMAQEKESTKEKELYDNDNDNDNDNDSIVATIRGRIVDESSAQYIYKLPLNIKNTYYPVTQDEIDFYKTIYPNVDVEQEYRNMMGWCNANPKKLKTKDGIKRFINTWLSKEQDKGGISKEEREAKVRSQNAYADDVELRKKQQEIKEQGGNWFD